MFPTTSLTPGLFAGTRGGGGGVKSHTGKLNLLPFHIATLTENIPPPPLLIPAAGIILCVVISTKNSA